MSSAALVPPNTLQCYQSHSMGPLTVHPIDQVYESVAPATQKEYV